MNVTCPECSTVYRLPDEKAKPGAKLRCSVCRHVFALPAADPVEEPVEEPLAFGEEQKGMGGLDMNGLDSAAVSPASLSEGLSLEGEKSAESLDIDIPSAVQKDEDEEDEQEEPLDRALDMPEEKPSRFEGMFGMLLCCAIVVGGIWAWQNTNYLDDIKALILPQETVSASKPATSAESVIEKLELLDVAQFQVKNGKIGRLVVIEGKVRNNFSSPRELISLEAELCDKAGKVLASRRQIAGISLSPFQLEVLDKAELENTLNRKLDIVTSNINVMPGAEVPFTVVFTEIPEGASDYKVRIVEASMVKPVGNLTK